MSCGAWVVVLLAMMGLPARLALASCPDRPGEAPCGPPEVVPDAPEQTPILARLEVGVLDDRAWVDAKNGRDDWGNYTGTVPVGGPVEARSVTFRVLYGYGGLYGGVEMGLGWLRRAPPVVGQADLAVWDFLDAEDGPGLGNSQFAVRALAGTEQRVGSVLIGAELALGGAGVTVGETYVGAPHVRDGRFLFDVRARAGVWLLPHVNATLLLGTSLVHDTDRTVGFMIGLTPFSFDGT